MICPVVGVDDGANPDAAAHVVDAGQDAVTSYQQRLPVIHLQGRRRPAFLGRTCHPVVSPASTTPGKEPPRGVGASTRSCHRLRYGGLGAQRRRCEPDGAALWAATRWRYRTSPSVTRTRSPRTAWRCGLIPRSGSAVKQRLSRPWRPTVSPPRRARGAGPAWTGVRLRGATNALTAPAPHAGPA